MWKWNILYNKFRLWMWWLTKKAFHSPAFGNFPLRCGLLSRGSLATSVWLGFLLAVVLTTRFGSLSAVAWRPVGSPYLKRYRWNWVHAAESCCYQTRSVALMLVLNKFGSLCALLALNGFWNTYSSIRRDVRPIIVTVAVVSFIFRFTWCWDECYDHDRCYDDHYSY